MKSIVVKGSLPASSASIVEGTIWKALLAFFFPILFGTFFQQLYNTVDAVIVGRFVGKQALAAVGGADNAETNSAEPTVFSYTCSSAGKNNSVINIRTAAYTTLEG